MVRQEEETDRRKGERTWYSSLLFSWFMFTLNTFNTSPYFGSSDSLILEEPNPPRPAEGGGEWEEDLTFFSGGKDEDDEAAAVEAEEEGKAE